MAAAERPRLVLTLEPSNSGDDVQIATFQLPGDDTVSDLDGTPNLGKALAFMQEYIAQEGDDPEPEPT